MRYIKRLSLIKESFQEENIQKLIDIILSNYGDDHLNQLRLSKDLRSITTKNKWLEFIDQNVDEDDKQQLESSFIENYLDKYSKDFIVYLKNRLHPKSVETKFNKWIDKAVNHNPDPAPARLYRVTSSLNQLQLYSSINLVLLNNQLHCYIYNPLL